MNPGHPGRIRRVPLLCGAALILSLPGTVWTPAALTGAERLEGMVVDVGGMPSAGAIVSMTGRGLRREALTHDGGGFLIEPVAPGVYLLSAAAGSIASEEVRIEIKDGEAPPHITLTLKPPLPVADP